MKTPPIVAFLLFAFSYEINGYNTRDLMSRIKWHSDSGNEPKRALTSNTPMADSNVPARRNSAWEAPIQFTSGPGDKWFYALTGEGTTVHFAQGNNNNILYRRSTDEGKTWGQDVTLGAGRIYLEKPFVVDGSNVYLVYFRNLRKARDWCCPRDLGDMFLRASTDGGITWQSEIQLSTTRSALRVAVAASGSNVHVVWMDFRSGIWDIYYRRSTTNGSTWGPEIKLVAGTSKIGSSVGAERPSIAVLGNSVHVVWMDGRHGAPGCYSLPECTGIYYKHSHDNGTTWEPDVRLTNDTLFSGRPSINAIAPSTLLVSFDHQEPGAKAENINVKKSTDKGKSWGESQKLSFLNTGFAGHNVMLSVGSSVHVAWFDDRDTSNKEVFYRGSNDAGATWSPEENVSQAPGESITPFLAATNNHVHILWGDRRTGALQIFYRRKSLS